MDDFHRFIAFERRLVERLSTRIIPFEHGVAYLDEEYRARYSSNFLLVDPSIDDISADTLTAAADRILGGAGYEHRELDIKNNRLGESIASALTDGGYDPGRNFIMVHRRSPDRTNDLDVEELGFADIAPLFEETYRRLPWADSEALVRTFTDQHGKFARVIGVRFFAVRVDGLLAGRCELYVDGDDAQVETVDTLEEFQGRGIARAVVLRAVEAAREGGADRVFIVADEDDWPKELYAKLGFDHIGRTWTFIRKPPGGSAAE
jgi:ribosomal protein S18 acetylase RimI-like enzyme